MDEKKIIAAILAVGVFNARTHKTGENLHVRMMSTYEIMLRKLNGEEDQTSSET